MQHEHKQCAGKGCTNEGKILLAVKYINLKGHFCESCAEDLLGFGLVARQDVGNGTKSSIQN
jgi:hypothetical protein